MNVFEQLDAFIKDPPATTIALDFTSQRKDLSEDKSFIPTPDSLLLTIATASLNNAKLGIIAALRTRPSNDVLRVYFVSVEDIGLLLPRPVKKLLQEIDYNTHRPVAFGYSNGHVGVWAIAHSECQQIVEGLVREI